MAAYHLAQFNIARTRGALDEPIMRGFVEQLAYINAVADRSPGFVWRLQTEDGDATAVRAFDDPRIIVNMSVWESIEALHAYVYRSDHVGPLRDRAQWFERLGEPGVVLWWIPAGTIPTVEDGIERLGELRRRGPAAGAFTFKRPFPPPGGPPTGAPRLEPDECEWTS